jgi:transcriptional regulator GlxA family with amidase domain
MTPAPVGIFVFDDVEVLDVAGPFEVFSRTRLVPGAESRRTTDSAPFDVFTVASSEEAVTAVGGLRILPQYSWRSAPAIEILVIPGGFGTRRLLQDDAAIEWIRSAAESSSLVTSVCTGGLLLARAGWLRGRHATTHWAAYDLLASLDHTIIVERGARVVHDGVITSAGVSAGIDMAFDVVERRCGRDVAADTASYIEYRRSNAPDGPIDSPLLARAASHASRYLSAIQERHVGPLASGDELRRMLRRPLPENGENGADVVDDLARAGLDGTTASQGPRYFGFVIGGSLPVATAAEWLVSAWDQNAQTYVMSPLASVVEDVAADWLKDLLEQVVVGVQNEGTCWLGGTEWRGRRAARISICNWSTTEPDIDRSAAAILGVVDRLSVRHL